MDLFTELSKATKLNEKDLKKLETIAFLKTKTSPQWKQILTWLQSGKCITDLEALRMFDCRRLSGRIYDLREQGYDIETEMIKTSTGKWIAKYKLN